MKILVFGELPHPLPGPLSEKLNFKFIINLKTDFSGVKKVKNWILTLNFTFSGQLGSLITARHTVRLSWNFQKLMQVRYTSDLRIYQVVKIFFPRVHEIAKKKTYVELFFSVFDVKYFFNKKTAA